jgi:hypothetical protein
VFEQPGSPINRICLRDDSKVHLNISTQHHVILYQQSILFQYKSSNMPDNLPLKILNTDFLIPLYPFINPIVNPADILPVRGMPTLVIAKYDAAA